MAEFTAAVVESYDRFMGRYATGLAPMFADAAGVRAGMRVLDVGCGPGALAVELARRIGEGNVAAIDPTPQFVAACQARIPGADVREGLAESLPWDDRIFDAAMCSLVVAWMNDADQGIGEMARVTKPGGTVAAASGTSPAAGCRCSRTSGDAASANRPERRRRRRAAERRRERRRSRRAVPPRRPTGRHRRHARDERRLRPPSRLLGPFTAGGGPASGAFYASLDDAGKATLRDTVRASLPDAPFTLQGRAWLALGVVPA